jgi:hypothetical protein
MDTLIVVALFLVPVVLLGIANWRAQKFDSDVVKF